MIDQLKVFYRREMVANVKTYSPSPKKPSKVMADWKQHNLPVVLCSFRPVTPKELYAVHDKQYVDGVLRGVIRNGFGTAASVQVAKSLLYTSGAMLAAAQSAIVSGSMACAPVSGFHHAGVGHASGYCTFNGLAVTAMTLKRARQADRVAILDLDYHYGDGTQAIIDRHGMNWVKHVSPGPSHSRDAERFLMSLPGIIRGFAGCDVLLYQAGADAHINDPLGGWMTTRQLAHRDDIVFNEARKIGLPVAWCLAGGYQQDADGNIPAVLEIHRNTVKACISAK